jgi:hypothetical protein
MPTSAACPTAPSCNSPSSRGAQSNYGSPRSVPRGGRRWALIALFGSLLSVTGCGHGDMPALGKVRGRVTFDNKPLVRALVAFQPNGNGRESFGYTDSDGKYELKYNTLTMGAGVGENSVRISTQRSNDPRTETVPPQYNKKTTLHYDVKPGENMDANFELRSK